MTTQQRDPRHAANRRHRDETVPAERLALDDPALLACLLGAFGSYSASPAWEHHCG